VVAVSVLALASIYTLPANAVHDAGAMQMDGNAQTSLQSNPAAADDWDLICKANPSTCTFKAGYPVPAGSTTANVSSHVADGAGASIFTGGGSKDPQDIPNWKWKDGSVPDKDNLQHAFAARYNLTPSATCPTVGGATKCSLLFFGSDRFDNSGDAQQGFWFFQNKVSVNANGTFDGAHANGDVLIVSDFSNGGTVSIINVYKWLNGALVFLTGGDSNKCSSALAGGDAVCGIVNPSDGTVAPWLYTDKSGNANYLTNEFYEAGINLSSPDINLGDECFSSFVAETRSSTSTTATLKDFVLGQFAVCTATMTTTPSTAVPVSPATAVHDTATVTGSNPAKTPTGTVTFFMCSFTAASTDTCDGSTGHAGTSIGTGTLSGSGAVATAVSPDVNTVASPLTPGKYCFRAEWPGDANYVGKVVEDGASECFIVRTIATTTVTTPSDSSGTALVSPVALGTQLFDKAVVTGTSVGGSPPGAVNFFLCDPTQVTGAAGAEVCPANVAGTALSGNPRTLVADAGSNPPTSTVLSSPGVNANKAGVWCFRADYVPTGTTYTGSSDGTHGECVTVSKAPTTTVTTPRVAGSPISGAVAVGTKVIDHAVVTGSSADGAPTGTVNFFICNPTEVANNGGTCSTGGTAAGSPTASATAGSSPPKTEADSDEITASSVGTWCFRAVYVPGGANGDNYTGSSDSSTGECFLVQDSTSVSSEQDWLPNDTATVAATGGTALNGTLVFTLYPTSDCTGTAVTGQTYNRTLTNASTPAERTKSTGNTTYLVKATATVSWKVDFTPDAGTNVSGSSHCESTSLTITN
jgi:hypothetical protein